MVVQSQTIGLGGAMLCRTCYNTTRETSMTNDDTIMPLGKLLGSIHRAHACRMDQSTEKLGIFRGQAILLLTLMERDGMTHSEIADKLRISHAAASKVITRMEGQGYVKRQTDPHDERVSRVYIQEAGKELTEKLRPSFQQINNFMFAGFSDQEKDQFRQYLLRIQENLSNFDHLRDDL